MPHAKKKKGGLKKNQKKRVGEVYAAFADPGSKLLSSEPDTLGNVMTSLTGVKVFQDEAELLQRRLDPEETGTIPLEILIEHVDAMLHGPSPEDQKATKDAFGVFDEKHAEVLDAVELKKILDKMPAGLLTPEERKKLIDEIAEDITPDDATFSYQTYIEDAVKASIGKKKKKKKKKKKA